MSEKQLTVAELLARAGKEGQTVDKPRRRRRSLEEGGISVAELTGSIPAVKDKPAESKHSSEPIDAPPKDPRAAKEKEPGSAKEPHAVKETGAQRPQDSAAPTPATDETAVIEKVTVPAPELDATGEIPVLKQEAPKSAVAEAPGVTEAPGVAGAAERAEAAEVAEASEPSEVAKDAVATDDAQLALLADQELGEGRGQEQPAEEEFEEAEQGRTSVAGVVLMAIIGVVLGVVAFKSFEALWSSFDTWIVAIVALVVTGVMVGVVKALRTSNDALSMGLATVVGLVVTFGPLLIVS